MLRCSLDSFELEGRQYHIRTDRVARESQKKEDAGFLASGSGLRAAFGALAHGGKEPVAGAPAALPAPEQDVGFPAETIVTFTVEELLRM